VESHRRSAFAVAADDEEFVDEDGPDWNGGPSVRLA
jgi:hypothetical protein